MDFLVSQYRKRPAVRRSTTLTIVDYVTLCTYNSSQEWGGFKLAWYSFYRVRKWFHFFVLSKSSRHFLFFSRPLNQQQAHRLSTLRINLVVEVGVIVYVLSRYLTDSGENVVVLFLHLYFKGHFLVLFLTKFMYFFSRCSWKTQF